MTALPPSKLGGRPCRDPDPYETKLTSLVAVHVPEAFTFPAESLWMNVPLPVTESGWIVKVPDPAMETVSPLPAFATSGHALGPIIVHMGSAPASHMYVRAPLSAKTTLANDIVSRRVIPATSVYFFIIRLFFTAQ